ncbi:MAG: methyltransferase domain-containing protein [Deltaproteobacteria bacterium]|nr:methyltransferase domain-containing protein [Deltaproteobacteria bacterium]
MIPPGSAFAALLKAQLTISRATSTLVGAAALRSLREPELDRLSALMADASSLHRSDRVEPWEERWWSTALPKKPGRILVAACGAGRELVWLLERGWEVEAFDPAPSLLAVARARVGARARLERLDFARFVDEVPRRTRVDAVLIGFGALSHCLSDLSRRRLMEACDAICPRGPILLSWRDGAGLRGRGGGAHALGARVGNALAELRGVGGAWREQLLFLPHAGPTAFLEAADLQALGASVGRSLELRSAPMPHGELVASRRARRGRTLDAAAVELLGEVLSRHGVHRMVARGGSMRPAIPSGTRLRLARASSATLGDVVAARCNGMLVIHRVIGVDAQGRMLIKGDACSAPDGWIDGRDLVGKVAALEDDKGARAVPPCSAPTPRWRRGLGRVARAWRALR